jgi:serine/threonine protein kinase/Flp pilus assembly protein TadD
MTADPKRVQSLFLAAVDWAAGDRSTALDMACGGDSDLRRRVIALLDAHESAGSLLDRPPEGVVGATALDPAASLVGLPYEGEIGGRIGPYTLTQKLGEGGMGTVWAAEQHAPIRRRVALKLIKPGMDSQQVLRRFAAERQALALMDHTNIAKVFDAGTTPEGRPFFAMELVKGVPITKYCDDLGLSVRERLELFLPVCQAIQHAHTKGVIHRDVKPTNVLVCIQDRKPVPKVIDFGVAKALHERLADRTLYTELGAVLGTLEYMSPEQAELSALDVDTRADVYALGVLLYELLTGATPLDRRRLAAAGLAEAMRIVKEEEPARPSTRVSGPMVSLTGLAAQRRVEPGRLRKLIRGDLDRIVMKCLEKDRTRRYETADALARDVERHLADEPIDARAPSRRYRLRKFTRRNRGPLAATALVMLALVAGTAVAGWQAIRATNARRLADGRAEQIRGDLLRLQAANVLVERGREHRLQRRWDDAEADLSEAVALRPDQLAARSERFDLYVHLGLWDRAASELTGASDVREPDTSFRWYLQSLLYLHEGDVADYHKLREGMRGRFHGGLNQFSEIDLVRASVLSPDPDAHAAEMASLLRRLMASRKKADWFFFYLSGLSHYRTGDYAAAADSLQKSTETAPPFAAMGYPCLAMAWHRLGRADEARKALDASADAIDGWMEDSFAAGGEGYWVTRDGAAPAFPVAWWDWLEFRIFFREAKLLIDRSPTEDDARVHVLRARAFSGLHRMGEADAEYRAALRLRPNDPRIRFESHRDRGAFLAEAHRFGEAAAEFARATELRPDDFQLWRFRAVADFAAGDVNAYRQDCTAMLERFGATEDPATACNVAYACTLQPDALPDPARLLPVADVAAPHWHFGTWVRGAVLYRAGRHEEAVRCFEDAAGTYRPRSWDWAFLAMAHHRLGHATEARRCLSEASRWVAEADCQSVDESVDGEDRGATRPAWGGYDERLVYPLLVREAAQLIRS